MTYLGNPDCFSSLLNGGEVTQVESLLVDPDAGMPELLAGVPVDILNARGVPLGQADVETVDTLGDGSQVVGSIVETIAVDVINHQVVRDRAVVVLVDKVMQVDFDLTGRPHITRETSARVAILAAVPVKRGEMISREGVIQDEGVSDDDAVGPIAFSGDRQVKNVRLGRKIGSSHDWPFREKGSCGQSRPDATTSGRLALLYATAESKNHSGRTKCLTL